MLDAARAQQVHCRLNIRMDRNCAHDCLLALACAGLVLQLSAGSLDVNSEAEAVRGQGAENLRRVADDLALVPRA